MLNSNTIITVAPDEYKRMLESYVSIVEKTNDQLGWWLVIGNYLVAILGVIIAVIAIFVTVVIYRNSKEQKQKFDDFLKEQKKFSETKMMEFEQESKKRREDSEKLLEKLIDEQMAKLKSATEDVVKKDIEKSIVDLRKTKATFGTLLDLNQNPLLFQAHNNHNFFGINNDSSSILLNSKSMKCFKCGNSFNYYQDSPAVSVVPFCNVHCTHCGAPNLASY